MWIYVHVRDELKQALSKYDREVEPLQDEI